MDDDPLILFLPLPPSVNKVWMPVRTRAGAAIIKRAASRDWAAQAKREVHAQRQGRKISTPFQAIVELPKCRGDIDNRIKQILDACQAGGAITNDKLCQRLIVERNADREGNVIIDLQPIK